MPALNHSPTNAAEHRACPTAILSCPHIHRQREAEAAEERSVQEYLRKRREREAAEAARQANKREAQDR